MNPKFLIQKTNWKGIAAEVSRMAGKQYPPDYIREVATGGRMNRQLLPILKDLGVLTAKAA